MVSPELDAFLGSTPRRPVRHWLSVVALIVALGVALALLVRFLDGPDLPYYTGPVERGDLTPVLSAHGTLHATGEVTVQAQDDGVIQTVPAPAEGPVAAGQVLATMDNGALMTAMSQAQATLAQDQGDAETARVSLAETGSKLDRFETVWRRSAHRVPSLNEMEGARADMARASVAFSAARAKIAADQALVREAQLRLTHASIAAPFAGSMVARLVTPGQAVNAGTPLFTLAARTDRLTVQVPLSAAEAMRLAPHARARVLAPALSDGPRNATLDRIDAADGQRLAVLTLDDGPASLRPGMDVTVEIDLPARTNVLMVPNGALTFAPQGQHPGANVWLLGSDNQPRQIPVAVEASDGKRTEVVANGLEPGAQVITGWRHSPGVQSVGGSPRRKP